MIAELIDARARVRRSGRLRRRLLRRQVLAVVRRSVPPEDRGHGGRRGRGPARQAGSARLRAVEGLHEGTSRGRPPGRRRGAAAARAGTWSAPRWRASTWVTSSTSTAAGWTCASRTTRTSWPSRPRSGRSSPGSGCTARWVTTAGEKMSKSIGNGRRACARGPAGAGRSSCGTTSVRALPVLWSSRFAALDEAATGFQADRGLRPPRADEVTGGVEPAVELPTDFVAAMDDDLGTPAAVAVTAQHRPRREQAGRRRDSPDAAGALAAVRGMLGVLGLDPLARSRGPRAAAVGDELTDVVDGLVERCSSSGRPPASARTTPRRTRSATGLKALGVVVEDTPQGPRWSLAAPTTDEGN